MKKEQLVAFLERKIKKKRRKKTLTCYSNFQMAFLEVPAKKKRRERLVAFLERKKQKKTPDRSKWQFRKVPA
jgi:hypothetical protein